MNITNLNPNTFLYVVTSSLEYSKIDDRKKKSIHAAIQALDESQKSSLLNYPAEVLSKARKGDRAVQLQLGSDRNVINVFVDQTSKKIGTIWLKMAAYQGCENSKHLLGLRFLLLDQCIKAMKWYSREGNVDGFQTSLKKLSEKSKDFSLFINNMSEKEKTKFFQFCKELFAIDLGEESQNLKKIFEKTLSKLIEINTFVDRPFPLLEALEGNAAAQYRMGRFFCSTKFNFISFILNNDFYDHELARQWWELSASQGDGNSAFSLGIINQYGLGVKESLPKALHYFQQAIEANCPALDSYKKCLAKFGKDKVE